MKFEIHPLTKMKIKFHPFLRPLFGYLQEIHTYLNYLIYRPKKENKKFVILSQHRSGSSLLVSLLDSHPNIHCESELFLYPTLFPFLYLDCRSKMSSDGTFGFKLMVNHSGYQRYQDPGKFLERLHQSGYTIIKLWRRNISQSAISLLYAQKTGKFHYKKTEKYNDLPKIQLELNEYIEKLAWLQQLSVYQEHITASLPHLEIIYENHLQENSEHQRTVNMITDYLGISRAQVKSDFVRMPAKDPGEYIENLGDLLAMETLFEP